jgi:hypothetical protein
MPQEGRVGPQWAPGPAGRQLARDRGEEPDRHPSDQCGSANPCAHPLGVHTDPCKSPEGAHSQQEMSAK